MNSHFTIVIADRNRHVREFLRREFSEAGFKAHVAKDGQEVLALVNCDNEVDLLILDLEMPHGDGLQILEYIRANAPALPVVIHSFLAEHANQPGLEVAAALVEKKGDPNFLKIAVNEVLRRSYPERFSLYVTGIPPGSGLRSSGPSESGY